MKITLMNPENKTIKFESNKRPYSGYSVSKENIRYYLEKWDKNWFTPSYRGGMTAYFLFKALKKFRSI